MALSTSRVHVFANFRAKPGHERTLRAELTELIGPTRQEEGCIRYELFENPQRPGDLAFWEEWESDAALDRHLDTSHIKASNIATTPLLRAPADIRRFKFVA